MHDDVILYLGDIVYLGNQKRVVNNLLCRYLHFKKYAMCGYAMCGDMRCVVVRRARSTCL